MTSDLRPERIASIEVSINWSVPVQQRQRGGAAGDAPRELSASDVGRELVVDDGRLVDAPVTSRPRARREPRMSEADYRLAEARSRLHGLEGRCRRRRALGVRPPA